jgi:hypothetical protein
LQIRKDAIYYPRLAEYTGKVEVSYYNV